MDKPIDEIEYKGYTIQVWYDFDPANPVEDWDMACKMVCWHRRYKLGHEQPREDPEEWLRDQLERLDWKTQEWLAAKPGVQQKMKEVFDANDEDEDDRTFERLPQYLNMQELYWLFSLYNVIMPLYLYDHGGISISTGSFHDEWDSGQVGWIYVSQEQAVKEWGEGNGFTAAVDSTARRYMKGEVNAYDEYLRGEVYGFTLLDPEGNDLDESTWGFYGRDYMIDECKEIIDHKIQKEESKKWANIQKELED